MADEKFAFSLSDEEKSYLKDLVRASIESNLDSDPAAAPQPPTDKLTEHLGAFVTLKLGRNLRGCIGHIVGDKPVYETVWEMAQAAAFSDPRFPPLTRDEFERLEIEISILSPIEPCPDTAQIEPGRHGLVVRRGRQTGLLLPQVATEWGWDAKTFLAQTCNKAGMEPTCYQDENTQVLWFEAEVF